MKALLAPSCSHSRWSAARPRPPAPHAGPIKIGISLSLSGDFSDSGKAAKRGYELWAEHRQRPRRHPRPAGRAEVRRRRVEPDAGRHELPEPDHARQRRPRLRPVLDAADARRPPGRRTATATRSSSRPAAAPPSSRRSSTTSSSRSPRRPSTTRTSSPTTSSRCRRRSGRRPRPTPRSTTRSRRRSPTASRQLLEAAGDQDGLQDDLPVRVDGHDADRAEDDRGQKPDLIVGGTQNSDAYAIVKALIQLKYEPEVPLPLERPERPGRVPVEGRREERERHLLLGRLVPGREVARQRRVRQGVREEVRRRAARSTRPRPRRTRSARSLQQRSRRSARSTTRRSSRRCTRARWPTVEGTLRWNAIGEPQGRTCSSSG